MMGIDGNFEQILHEGKLYRDVNALIVAHLRDNNLNQVLLLFLPIPNVYFNHLMMIYSRKKGLFLIDSICFY